MSIQNDFRSAAISALKSKGVSSDVSERVSSYMLAQARLESADFSSSVYVANNNAIGMHVPSVRSKKYIAGVGTSGYAKYANISDCAYDLVEWLVYNHANFNSFDTFRNYTDFCGDHGYYGISKDQYYARSNRFVGESGAPPSVAFGMVPQSFKTVGYVLAAAAGLYMFSRRS